MRAFLLVTALTALALVVPAATTAAPLLTAPTASLDGSALFSFRQVDIGSVATVEVGGKSYQRTVTESSFSILIEDLEPGFQRWWANVTLGNATWRDAGYVHVDTSVLTIGASVTELEAMVASLENKSAALAADNARLSENLTSLQDGIDGVAATQELALAQAEGPQGNQSANPNAGFIQPGPVGLDLGDKNVQILLGVVAAAVGLLALNVMIVIQMRKRNRDSMVFLLAIAGREGVTPDSPEFQKALAAISGKKPKKEKADKKAKKSAT